MRVFQIGTVFTLIAIGLLAFQNCAKKNFAAESSIGALEDEITNLKSSIHSLNQELNCSQDEDCQALGLGSRPCGGPADFIAVSTMNTNYDQILTLADELEEKSRIKNIQQGLAGTCDMIVPPDIRCVSNVCQ